jgi:hypothetical protein
MVSGDAGTRLPVIGLEMKAKVQFAQVNFSGLLPMRKRPRQLRLQSRAIA